MQELDSRVVFMTAVIGLLAGTGASVAEDFECLVEPYLVVNLSSGVPGILGSVRVDRGDVVRQGQTLARLKSKAQEAHIELIQAKAEFAARRVERNADLYLKQMISPDEKDQLETEAQLLQLELREAVEQLALRAVVSPLDGVVVERYFSTGEFVSEDPIFKLAQIDPLRVEAALPVRLFGRVEVGMRGRVEWEVPEGTVRTGTVTVVDPVVDAASGTIGVRLELPNPDRGLPAGTKCRVSFAGL